MKWKKVSVITQNSLSVITELQISTFTLVLMTCYLQCELWLPLFSDTSKLTPIPFEIWSLIQPKKGSDIYILQTVKMTNMGWSRYPLVIISVTRRALWNILVSLWTAISLICTKQPLLCLPAAMCWNMVCVMPFKICT